MTGALADELRASDYLDGCPVATVVLEAAGQSAPLQAICSRSYARWQTLIEDYLRASGFEPDRAQSMANLVLCAIEGALLLSRAHRDTTPLRAVGEQLAGLVSSASGTA